jgi:hypothetical protein
MGIDIVEILYNGTGEYSGTVDDDVFIFDGQGALERISEYIVRNSSGKFSIESNGKAIIQCER